MAIADDEVIQRYLDQAFWPWGLALAYCQPVEDRERAIAAVIYGLEVYAAAEREQSYAGAASYSGLTDGQRLDWPEFASVEQRLLGPVQAGQVDVFGRASASERLEPIPVVDWVGAEVDYEHTCDLVRAGWRDKDPLGQALDGPRQTIRYDLHLAGAAVRQLAAAVDAHSIEACDSDEWDRAGIDDCLRRATLPREGLWSAWAALAWVASRNDHFVAAVQLYETEQHADRGEIYACSAWMTLGNKAGEVWGRSFTDAFADLKEALGGGQISASAIPGRFGQRRVIEPFEWGDAKVAFESSGLWLIGGMHSLLFPAAQIRAAFKASGGPVMDACSELSELPQLPPSAKPNDYKYAEFAHQAAVLVRSKKILPQAAFRQVAPEVPMRQPASIERAIRHAYDLLYDSNGVPRQN